MFRVQLAPEYLAKLPEAQQANIKRPIHLQHGLTGSSDNYFINSEGGKGDSNSIGMWLVDQGYDVWAGNNRGNKYSKNSDVTDPRKYYDFSYTEFGQYDVPAMVKYILKTTENEDGKVTWIGHSEGTTQMFIGLSDPKTKDYLNAHIERFIALAPITYLNQVASDNLKEAAKFEELVLVATEVYGLYEMFTGPCVPDAKWDELKDFACKKLGFLCPTENSGLDPSVANMGVVPYIAKLSPGGASVKQFAHYAQFIKSAYPIFNNYDYGYLGNMLNYGTSTPPAWDVSQITVPLTMLAGELDDLATKANNDVLLSNLSGKQEVTYIPGYHHSTFLYPKDIGDFSEYITKALAE